ncbi:MAG: aminotransferase class I/II-fold pyridoxal phosphate-dependent enzyme, partial [Lentisphaeria bacterium]|nr:aminotransferase class I/II-fold pyridoxal phosphate-dependent enzyme [Lentisphaeria bacterium]
MIKVSRSLKELSFHAVNAKEKLTEQMKREPTIPEIAKYLERRFDLHYHPENEIIVTVGGSEAIDLMLRTLLNPGDEVIIPEPTFVCYDPLTQLCGGVPVPLVTTAEENFKLTPEALRAHLTPKTKVLVLPYPTNPTGGIMTYEDLEGIAEVLRERDDVIVLSDEVYAELTFGRRHVSIASLPGMWERTVVISSMSKAHAMTGWRLGYACGPKELISVMTKVHQYGIMSAPTTAQYAAIEAFASGDDHIEFMRDDYDRRRRLMVDGLRRIGLDCYEPEGAFYLFPSIKSTGLSSEDFCEKLLLEERVAVIAGNSFGDCGEGY